MFYTNRKHWTTAEENFVAENADKMTTAEIARKINRTEVAVQQYMHRKRINPYEKVVRNLVREILTNISTRTGHFMIRWVSHKKDGGICTTDVNPFQTMNIKSYHHISE